MQQMLIGIDISFHSRKLLKYRRRVKGWRQHHTEAICIRLLLATRMGYLSFMQNSHVGQGLAIYICNGVYPESPRKWLTQYDTIFPDLCRNY